MRALLIWSSLALAGCTLLSHPVRASSLGAPTTVTAGEREFIGGVGFLGQSESLNPDQNVQMGQTTLIAGTLREGLTDRISAEVGSEFSIATFSQPQHVGLVGGLRYTTDPKPRQRNAIWADLELGLGGNMLLYEISSLVPAIGVYTGAGIAARLNKLTTFARYRFQLVDGIDQATADYHAMHVGVQGALTPSVDLYAGTGLATAGGRTDLEREKYTLYGPFPLHIDLGVRVRLPDRSTRGGLPSKRSPRERLCPCPPDDPATEPSERPQANEAPRP